jgi:hypothetical protein
VRCRTLSAATPPCVFLRAPRAGLRPPGNIAANLSCGHQRKTEVNHGCSFSRAFQSVAGARIQCAGCLSVGGTLSPGCGHRSGRRGPSRHRHCARCRRNPRGSPAAYGCRHPPRHPPARSRREVKGGATLHRVRLVLGCAEPPRCEPLNSRNVPSLTSNKVATSFGSGSARETYFLRDGNL